ncbi:MAG: PID-CTERM protein-sorting domain-containing protein [Flavisolibacter sp.]
MKFKFIISFFTLLACMALPSLLLAQGGDPGGDPDPAVPFDGGLSALIAAGIAYAAKKGYDKRKKLKEQAPQEK